jgi:hypothetical protein
MMYALSATPYVSERVSDSTNIKTMDVSKNFLVVALSFSGVVGCSSVPQSVTDQAKAECAHITSSWERAKCRVAFKREWERDQQVEAALKDCKRYWPEERKAEIAQCVDKKVNPSAKSGGSTNSAASIAICTALSGGNAGSCAAGVAKGTSGERSDSASERVKELEEELERKQQKFSQDCLFSGGVAVGDTCLNRRR